MLSANGMRCTQLTDRVMLFNEYSPVRSMKTVCKKKRAGLSLHGRATGADLHRTSWKIFQHIFVQKWHVSNQRISLVRFYFVTWYLGRAPERGRRVPTGRLRTTRRPTGWRTCGPGSTRWPSTLPGAFPAQKQKSAASTSL